VYVIALYRPIDGLLNVVSISIHLGTIDITWTAESYMNLASKI